MGRSVLADAFEHHVWATQQLINTCLTLSPEQLETSVPGTYGSILATMRHVVGGDSWYLFYITGERSLRIDEDQMDLRQLRLALDNSGAGWSALLEGDLDPDAVLLEIDEDDGYQKEAPVSIRLAQALHHGSDHRSQICTVLTKLGVKPPNIDAWDFGIQNGRVVEIPPTP